MRIADRYAQDRPVFSFEFFPPKTDKGFTSLYRTIQELKLLNPDFVSVTWGAGGSTRRKTVEIVVRIQQEIGLTAMAHLSCIGSAPDQIAETLGRLEEGGIENVLALGGDRPPDYVPPSGAFTHANELAEFIRSRWSFCLGGACYPESHPAAPSPEVDLENLVRKVNAGVDFLITQLYFDNADYFAFVELDDALTHEVGVQWATLQCRELLERGVPGIHFYTLNKSTATRAIFRKLLEG